MGKMKYVPITPGGTICIWLESKSKAKAWQRLMKDAAHMPYRNKAEFQARGYTVERMEKQSGN